MDVGNDILSKRERTAIKVDEPGGIRLGLPANFPKVVVRNRRVELVPILIRLILDKAVEDLEAAFE